MPVSNSYTPEEIRNGSTALFLFIFSAAIVWYVFRYFFLTTKEKEIKKVQRTLFPADVPAFLEKNLPYYRALEPRLKEMFAYRLKQFYLHNMFVNKGSKRNESVNVLISALATQLSFGLDDVKYDIFDTIILYPNIYYNGISKQKHKGEINPRLGVMVLSIEHFIDGIEDEKDGISLGLHELAHALYLGHVDKNDNTFLANFDKWKEEADRIIALQKINPSSFFRTYAFTNIDEFFAVCVENFFERPQEFNSLYPSLFKSLCDVLKQNPIHVSKPVGDRIF